MKVKKETVGVLGGAASQMGGMFKAAAFAAAAMALRQFGMIGEDFNRKMRSSLAIMGDVSQMMRKDMREAAFAAAEATQFSASQSAESFFFLASAGLTAKQSIAALPQVALFAQAGMFDMSRATDLATDAQSALGLTVKDAQQNLTNLTRVTDVLVKANTLANASVEQFATALTTKAGAALKIVGKSIEEGVAVLAAFADQGLKSSEAGTALNIVFRDLQTKALKNKTAFKEAGIAVFDSAGAMRNMADIIGDLEKRLAGMTAEGKKTTLMQLGFADKSLIFLQTLLGTSEKIREYERELRKAGGTTKMVAEKQLTPLQKGMAKFGAVVARVTSSIMKNLGPALGAMLRSFAANLRWLLKITVSFLAYKAAVVVVSIALRAYGAALRLAAAASYFSMAALGPVGWVKIAAGIAAATAAVVAMNTALGDTADAAGKAAKETEKLPKTIKELVDQKSGIEGVTDAINKLGEATGKVPKEKPKPEPKTEVERIEEELAAQEKIIKARDKGNEELSRRKKELEKRPAVLRGPETTEYYSFREQQKLWRKLKADWKQYYRDVSDIGAKISRASKRKEELEAELPKAKKREAERLSLPTLGVVQPAVKKTEEERKEEEQEVQRLVLNLERFRIEQREDSLGREIALIRNYYQEELRLANVSSKKYRVIRDTQRAEMAAAEKRHQEKELRWREEAEEKFGRGMEQAAQKRADRQKELADLQVGRQKELEGIRKQMVEGGPRLEAGRFGAAELGKRLQEVLLKQPNYQAKMLEELKNANKKHDKLIEAFRAEDKPGVLA